VADFGAGGEFLRRRVDFVADAGLQFHEAGGGGFAEGFGAGALLACGGEHGIGRLRLLIGLLEAAFGLCARIGGGIAACLGAGNGVQQGLALFGDGGGHRIELVEFRRHLAQPATEFGDLFGGGLATGLPAALFVGDGRKALAAARNIALQRVELGAGLGSGGARLDGRVFCTRDLFGKAGAVAQLRQRAFGMGKRFEGRIAGLAEAADLGFEGRETRHPLGGGAGRPGGRFLGRDLRPVGLAGLVLCLT